MDHPAADHAKDVLQVAAAGTGVPVSDGSTNVLPVGSTERSTRHGRCTPAVRRSLERVGCTRAGTCTPPAAHPVPGDLPVLPVRPRAGGGAGARLRRRGVRGVLDEPATVRALTGFLLRGVRCGAVTAAEVEAPTGMPLEGR